MKALMLENYLVLKAKDSRNNFSLNDSVWFLSKDVKLNFSYFESNINANLLASIKETLAYTAVNFSSAYARKFFFSIKKLVVFNQGKLDKFDYGLLNRFYNAYYKISYTHVESLKYFLIKLYELNNEFLDQEMLDLISKWKVTKPNKTTAYIERKESLRPLSEYELKNLIGCMTKEYKEGSMTMNDYLLVMLMIYSGRRPMQIAQLKRKDLYVKNNGNYLNIPRLKQGDSFRTEFSELRIGDNLFNSLSELKSVVKVFVQSEVGDILSEEELNNLPLFIDPNFFNSAYKLDKLYENNFFNLHMSSKRITSRVQAVCKRVSKDKNKKINSRQLRVTLATRLALKGYGLGAIAKALDHSNLESVLSYAKNNEEFSFRIDQAINDSVSPYIASFSKKSDDITLRLVDDLIIIKELTKELIAGYTKQAEFEILTDFSSILECKINKIVELLNWESMNNELL
ncbi:site-specific integrase [Escherichia coli]|uniref:Site-specific integrase n=5 Tax=Enterobacteriaceae TaxID=543 RepID=A0A427KIL7_ENTCL|nr:MULTISPECIES: site-specific integrase [Enterobacterales]EAA2658523.1 site-specific integrase [Salmonella enterica subsp. enterica serovar Hadar]EBK2978324.1 site-specific integrase [Salmonella enterica]EDR2959859.1 site-specific integrase [Salmonella enterica subsp. enterica serovar Oranienburg]EDT1726934.1 site-specific integrase [Salmonella enterica subsp. enterica]EDT9930551.1 site-specific integrase [Salmonella enterica subsp. enterica serovar Poano]EFT1037799.1 site-specific integrase